MKGIRDYAFFFFVIGIGAAVFYEYGKQRATVEYLFERWDRYQTYCLWAAVIAFVVACLASIWLWFIHGLRKELHRHERQLVQKTEQRVNAERDEAERRQARLISQITQRLA